MRMKKKTSIFVKLETRNTKKNYRFLQIICLNGRRNHVNMVFFARESKLLGKNVWRFETGSILLLISDNSSLQINAKKRRMQKKYSLVFGRITSEL